MALLVIGKSRSAEFAAAVRERASDLDVRIWPEAGPIEDIRYALAWGPPPGVLKTLPNLKLIISVGAGVDHLLEDPQLPDVPIVRFVDADLTGRMAAYVTLHVLYHHRRMTEFRELQEAHIWRYLPEPAAHELTVGIMGLGVLGQAAAKTLGSLGYGLAGWGRTSKAIAGISCHAGEAELERFLRATDILTVLLPLTPDTRGIINASLLSKLRRSGKLPGPVLINASRGGLQIEGDVLASLQSGQLYAATLDVFATEPLPKSSPFWGHPRVVVTPHNAAESMPSAIAAYAVRQIAAFERGRALQNLVDRRLGY